MRNAAVLLCAFALVATSGCATMRYPTAYKVEGKAFREFKELDDETALKLVVMICNVKHDQWEENIARSIALREYISLLAKRNSPYLKKSGIFKFQYEKVDLRKWKDQDLENLYDSLTPKCEGYYLDAAPNLTDMQNAERIMYLTALSAINTEMRRRNNANNMAMVAGQLLVGALSIALAML